MATTDPYEVLGLKRGASFTVVKSTYRKLVKQHHPDAGGTPEAFVALNAAYERILFEITEAKRASAQKKADANRSQDTKRNQQGTSQRAEREQREEQDNAADMDDELERLRREAKAREEATRKRDAEPSQGWRQQGRSNSPSSSTQDFFRKFSLTGLRGLAVVTSALMGFGALLLEFNIVGILILLGALIGYVASKGFKLGKNGLMPLGFSLIVLSLIFVSILPRRERPKQFQPPPPVVQANLDQQKDHGTGKPVIGAVSKSDGPPAIVNPANIDPVFPTPVTLPPRVLRAAPESVLKIMTGVPYQLLLRTGKTTHLIATEGKVAQYDGNARIGACVISLEFVTPAATTSWSDSNSQIQSCDDRGAVLSVSSVE